MTAKPLPAEGLCLLGSESRSEGNALCDYVADLTIASVG